MAKRLSVKHRKSRLDSLRAYREGKAPKRHKTSLALSRKAKRKNSFRMT